MGHLHLRVNSINRANALFVEILGFQKSLDYGPSASLSATASIIITSPIIHGMEAPILIWRIINWALSPTK
jgi:hypothetical protein